MFGAVPNVTRREKRPDVLHMSDAYEPKRLGCLAPHPEATEGDRLRAFADVLDRKPELVTFNGRGFDLPVLQLRAMRLGLPLPYLFHKDVRYRYSENGHLDLCDHITDFGAARRMRLSDLARLIGLPGKQGMDGSKVEDAIAAGMIQEVREYCLSDVVQTAFLMLRWKLLQGEFKPGEYQSVAVRLHEWLKSKGYVPELLREIDEEVLLLPSPF